MRGLSVEVIAEERVAFLRSQLVKEDDWDSFVNGVSGEKAAVPAVVLHQVRVAVVPDGITPLPRVGDEMIDDRGDAEFDFRTNPESGCAVQHVLDSFAQEVAQAEFVRGGRVGDHVGFRG